jgi:hypothetical protein
MTNMATAIRHSEEELKAMMPNKVIPPIGSETEHLTWQEIKVCLTKCAENAALIPSDGGDGLLGHVAIVVGDVRYSELSNNNVPYNEPPQAGPVPVYPANANTYQKDKIKRNHIKANVDYYTYHAVGKIITQQALEAVHDDNYKLVFYTEELGYRCTFQQLIAYLDNAYGSKTSAELTTNSDELKKPWNATTPIQSLFVRVDKCHCFDTTIPEDTIVRQVVDLICVHRGFESAYADWEAMRMQDKTWVNLKLHFGAADATRSKILLLQTRSALTTYPGSANSATSTTPPTQVELLTTAVNKLVKAMNKTSASGGAAATTDAAGTMTGTPRPHTPVAANPPGGREPIEEEAAAMSYCWSHGYCPHHTGTDPHTGVTCTRHRIGHEPTATGS